MNDFEAALEDCDIVQKLDPTQAKSKIRKEKALKGLRQHPTSDISIELQSSSAEGIPPNKNSTTTGTSTSTHGGDSLEGLKMQGNTNFKNGNYGAAIDFYTRGIYDGEDMKKILYCNRAALHLLLCDYASDTINDCEVVLAMDSTHTRIQQRHTDRVWLQLFL